MGLHKLLDIGLVQTGARDKVYNDILKGQIDSSDIKQSNYYGDMKIGSAAAQ